MTGLTQPERRAEPRACTRSVIARAQNVITSLTLAVLALLASVALGACDESRVSRDFGAACTENADCERHCLLPSKQFPSGLCTRTCHDDNDCVSPGTRCAETLDGHVCLTACEANLDCTFYGHAGDDVWLCLDTKSWDGTTIKTCQGTVP